MNILHIDCSPRPESHSRELSAAIVKMLLEACPGAGIVRRDFGVAPLPHAPAEYAIALSSPLVRRVFRPLIEPKPDWLFTHRDERKSRRFRERGPSRIDPTGSRRS